jgi:hypothetical protein
MPSCKIPVRLLPRAGQRDTRGARWRARGAGHRPAGRRARERCALPADRQARGCRRTERVGLTGRRLAQQAPVWARGGAVFTEQEHRLSALRPTDRRWVGAIPVGHAAFVVQRVAPVVEHAAGVVRHVPISSTPRRREAGRLPCRAARGGDARRARWIGHCELLYARTCCRPRLQTEQRGVLST